MEATPAACCPLAIRPESLKLTYCISLTWEPRGTAAWPCAPAPSESPSCLDGFGAMGIFIIYLLAFWTSAYDKPIVVLGRTI